MNRRTGEQTEGKTAKDQQTHLVPEGTVADIYISEVGGSPTGKSFRVVPCVRTCVRAVLGLVRFQANRRSCPFPFPFYRAGFSLFPYAAPAFPFSLMSIYSLFPCEHHEEMDSNEIK